MQRVTSVNQAVQTCFFVVMSVESGLLPPCQGEGGPWLPWCRNASKKIIFKSHKNPFNAELKARNIASHLNHIS